MKLSYKISYYILYALFAVILIVLGMFYFGGEMAEPVVPELSNPANTEALIYLMYVLLGSAIAVTVLAFVFQFGAALKENPVKAIKSLIGVLLLVAVLVVAWFSGSEEALVLPGYDGTDNVPFWLKLTDMFLYSIYFLLVVTIASMIFSSVKRRFS
ncbi:hypothetical protein Bcop_0072 [Bacteroides coprosuis DSM 18011]|uniref:Transmembrane protein n=1 Tax=Bacteroides coprosuis DSM 18011 TaxID=679937 RepID=F3ZP64_9BACE|nr:hypothetical protein [Bacteroides coprosuis]EGJ70291.1 hypothetical protein Bcop_0072 [Bacteroides coprosuis DSM 18011]HJD93314.1 hypothetical protein [Bacteroides coprosuis]